MISKTSKVLYVDDFVVFRNLVAKALSELGYEKVEGAVDGEEALQKLINAQKSGQPFDLILSDWNMPKVSGLELLQAVRSSEALKNITFVMITAEKENQHIVEAVNAGVDDYIMKPVNKNQLADKILALNQRQTK